MTPDLSIIIPTLNEAESLPRLLTDLAGQIGVPFEVIVADGGSRDATVAEANARFVNRELTGRCLEGPRGRGRQLNAGVTAASAPWLLFLHADSRLPQTDQLQRALGQLRAEVAAHPDEAVAGRFRLRFDCHGEAPAFGLYFYEAKAALGRSGCIHGDQGFMMARTLLTRLGPFREELPVMEDTTLAEAVLGEGRWLLLPGEIITSARRFRVEGLKARQTLNALMMNFRHIGWHDFFAEAPAIYRNQDRARPLELAPFFGLIRRLLAQMPATKRHSIWLNTGRYVCGQSWQIGLYLDCRRAFAAGRAPEQAAAGWLRWFDGCFEPLTNHRIGHIVTALLVRLWFALQPYTSIESQGES
jgi:rSAM/selenodomain-associated transferase 2